MDKAFYLPFKCVQVLLRFNRDSELPLFHNYALGGFLKTLLEKESAQFRQAVRLEILESGKTQYQEGEYYAFNLYLIGSELELHQRVLAALVQHQTIVPFAKNHSSKFGPNLDFVKILDLASGQPIANLHELTTYSETDFEEELRVLTQNDVIELRLQGRLILTLDDGSILRDSSQLSADLLMRRISKYFCDFASHHQIPAIRFDHLVKNKVHVKKSELIWLEDRQASNKDFRGVSGRIFLAGISNIPKSALGALVMGQYVGFGKSAPSFGTGRYGLYAEGQAVSSSRHALFRQPATTLLNRVVEEENLKKAWAHVFSDDDIFTDEDVASGYADIESGDETEPLQAPAPIAKMGNDLNRVKTHSYIVPDVRGVLISKPSGGVRALAIPPIYDRCLQRAVAQTVSPVLEKLFHKHSFGYRKGRSRLQAADQIRAAWQQGYRWVLESDIDDFFNSIPWHGIELRLNAVFAADPIVQAIMAWMKAEIIFENQRVPRTMGVPQGAPLSPLVANLVLDDFDNDMQMAGFKMVRYADDFVVMCKSKARAESALEAARNSLAEHGLSLKPSKTRIVESDQGFKYLGYLFVNDLVLEVKSGQTAKTLEDKLEKSAQEHAWFRAIAATQPKELATPKALQTWLRKISAQKPINIGAGNKNGITLFETGDHGVISTYSKQCSIVDAKNNIKRIPWTQLSSIILFANYQITTQAMRTALRNNVPIHLANGVGRYLGIINANQSAARPTLWFKQLNKQLDKDQCLLVGKALVGARIKNLRETLRQRGCEKSNQALLRLNNKAQQAEDLQTLMGFEGQAAKQFFAEISDFLDHTWAFTGRNRRLPKDPFNVLLSIGYTVIYSHTVTLLHAQGLYPWQGFLHKSKGNHAALASDMMEPFRHYAERVALSMLNRNELNPQDFSTTPAGRCVISHSARKLFLAKLSSYWQRPVTTRLSTEKATGLEHLEKQILSLKEYLRDKEDFQVVAFR